MGTAETRVEAPEAASERVSPRAWYALIVLVFLYMLSMIDRSIISMLIGSIKADLNLDDFQASLLMGTAFGIAYVAFATPFGWAADRYPRPYVLAFGLAFWSLACMSCGLAASFIALFASRMAVGAGEASLSPAAYPLITDLFPRRRMPTAMAIFHFGGATGGALALLLGGVVASFAAQSGGLSLPVVGELRPWQIAFLVVGLPGLPIALVVLSVREPRRFRPKLSERPAETVNVMSFVRRHPRLMFCHYVGFALTMMVAYGEVFWVPEYLVRTFGWDMVRIGSVVAATTFASSLIGQIAAVQILAILNRRGHSDAALRAFVYILIFGAVVSFIAFSTSNPVLAIAALFLSQMALAPTMTFGSSALQLFSPPHMRGRLSGLFISLVSLMGLGVGPAVIGAVTEYVLGGKDQIGSSLVIVTVVGQLFVAAMLAWGLAPARRAIAEQAALEPQTQG